MTAKKLLLPFLLASLAGHALVIALTARVAITRGYRSEMVMKVELKAPSEAKPPEADPPPAPAHGSTSPPHARTKQPPPPARTKQSPVYREDSVGLQNQGGPYEAYLVQIRRKIEGLWSYPPQALSGRREGDAEIRFTIDARGALTGYYITSSSGSPLLDEGALACVRAASPFAPLPAAFKLSRLHITATFRYRLAH